MLLTEKLKAIPGQIAKIRESLTITDPRVSGTPALEGQGEHRISQTSHQREARILETAKFLRDIYKGDRPMWQLQEAMTTSDFPLLFGDVLYRQLLGQYEAWPVTYPSLFRITELNDFRTLNMYKIDGGGGIGLEKVAERAPYPEVTFSESKTTLAVAKYGRRYGVSFEMMINDDLNAFQDRPAVMASDARMSEQLLATQTMWDANGPHASMYTVGNANIITGNPVLSITALQTAMTILGEMRDSEDRPIMVTMVNLVVPPALEIVARNILQATELRLNENGGASNNLLITGNWMKNRMQLQVDPFIPLVVTTGTRGRTSWSLVASTGVGRPAFHFGFLRGRRQPQLSMKDPNQISLGGGLGQMDGDFDTDSIDYRVRHIFGAAQGDPKMTVGSNGTAS